MNILFFAVNDTVIPPPSDMIRATASVCTILSEGLLKKGHTVSFVCPQGSTVGVNKIFTSAPPLVSLIGKNNYYAIDDPILREELLAPFYFNLFNTLLNNINLEKFDLVHIHTDIPLTELMVASKIDVPVLFTLHTSPKPSDSLNSVIRYFNKKNNYFISISNQQRKQFPAIKFSDTVYNGLIIDKNIFDQKGGKNLLFAGRLKKSKGILEAIEIALKTRHKLLITGSLSYSDREFFETDFMPQVKKYPQWLNYSGYTQDMNTFYRQGKVLIFPIQWEEPFGLVMIEAMACGTPVVAFAKGSVPEVIKDGQTGYIVNASNDDKRGDWIIKKTGIEGLCEALEKIYSMPQNQYLETRENCRKHVEENFTSEKMISNYERIYERILREK